MLFLVVIKGKSKILINNYIYNNLNVYFSAKQEKWKYSQKYDKVGKTKR